MEDELIVSKEVNKIGLYENLYYAVNVFAWEVKEIYNVGISEFSETKSRATIILLLIELEGRKHYTLADCVRNKSAITTAR